jgi:Asp-tRNA(Asn)/Glu-tRNA(Gln) amidotransferase A subunit family amidase
VHRRRAGSRAGALLQEGYREEHRDFSDTRQLYLNIPKLILDDFYDDWIRLLSSPQGGRFSPYKELLAQLLGKPTVDNGLLQWMLIAPIMKTRSQTKIADIAEGYASARSRYQSMLGADGVLVLPTLGLLAPPHGKMNRQSLKPGVNGLFTAHTMGNYLDLPAIAIPAWKFKDPPPASHPASPSCAPGAEAKLFAAARCVESVLNM